MPSSPVKRRRIPAT
ncbi:hypothetical protein CRUP_017380 [Coryphaenoides rupestris]|nr:hypothetical protein CRUP_017380 [Coryphaenoides rupestris]